jgi:2-deoxy-D-gluconate 3-dehydrogenase
MLMRRKLAMTIFDLQKRVAFITGGNGGIGLGMAKGLACAGATVVIAGRNKTKAQSALSELHSLGAQAEFVELDVLSEASCSKQYSAPSNDLEVSTSLSTTQGRPFARNRKT